MKLIFTSLAILVFISLTQGQGDEQFSNNHPGIHKGVVLEVLQTTSYTYLLVEENGVSRWLAIPKIEAEVGETYLYQGGNEMVDFKSNQLNRVFESVYFLGGVVNADLVENNIPDTMKVSANTREKENKVDVIIDPVEGGISIADLLANKEKYAGKTVKVKGKVTQFNASIMGRNWIHIQDGTDHEGDFDLTVTSPETVEQGEIVVLEGKIILDKDFGFGYFYSVMMEEGNIVR